MVRFAVAVLVRGVIGVPPQPLPKNTHLVMTDKKKPGPRHQAAIDKARARSAERPIRVSVEIECEDDNTMKLVSNHADPDGHVTMLQEAFGTVSNSYVGASMVSLEWMTRQRGTGKANDVTSLNAALALMGAIDPQDELEAALAMQMAGCHSLSVEMLGRARQASDIEHIQTFSNLAVKLQRTFTAQIEALGRMRGKGQQTVRVEHVTVAAGAQAIVGDVHHHARGGGASNEFEDQCHEAARRAGAPQESSPLLGQDPQGNGVPIACDAQWKVSNTRGEKPRSTARKSKRA
jgi:hypothetical protein